MKKLFRVSTVLLGVLGILLFTQSGCKGDEEYSLDELLDSTWVLQEFHFSDNLIQPAEARFTVIFRSNDAVEFLVDCNNCFGNYSASRGVMSFYGEFACTEAFCGPDSQDTLFLNVIDDVTRFEINGGTLLLYFVFNEGEGYLVFNK